MCKRSMKDNKRVEEKKNKIKRGVAISFRYTEVGKSQFTSVLLLADTIPASRNGPTNLHAALSALAIGISNSTHQGSHPTITSTRPPTTVPHFVSEKGKEMSSTAGSPSEDQGGKSDRAAEQIAYRFCAECSNFLYPKEDEDRAKLMFTCRTCKYSEEATSTCVYRNVLNNAAGETAGVTQDVASDPTVGGSASPTGPMTIMNLNTDHPSSSVSCPGPTAPVLRAGTRRLFSSSRSSGAQKREW